ncbi:unnamed protein product [Nezara viridula]|uniref:Phosphatidylinositol 3,4,5-trisphosphate 3-phosphatase and dual-specificity protein phosphatase PTEN n=1 Tax=Nezara viridula TaxID=85310 RepID=A0A9P0HEA6_NEZVI|nr:unnamed protein product [Nezara viridula]
MTGDQIPRKMFKWLCWQRWVVKPRMRKADGAGDDAWSNLDRLALHLANRGKITLLHVQQKDFGRPHLALLSWCSERSYDVSKFQQRVANYPFDDHNPPKIEVIKPFCEDVHTWLSQDSNNVAAVHCKAGKGRTGVMVCCYMIHAKLFETANEALNYYGHMRTTDTKGVTIPSQRRYVNYYASLVQEGLEYSPVTLTIREIRLEPLPNLFNGTQGCVMFVISEGKDKVFTSEQYDVKKGGSYISIKLEVPPVQGDIKVEFFSKQKMIRKEKMFHFWFNTFFVREEFKGGENGNSECNEVMPERSLSCVEQRTSNPPQLYKPRANSLVNLETEGLPLILRIDKWDLDDAHKDKGNKVYPSDFRVSVVMSRVGALWTRRGPGISRETPSESSDDTTESSTADEDEDGWESVEAGVGRYSLLTDLILSGPPS